MNKHLFYSILIICISLNTKMFAQTGIGARINGMANTGVAVSDVWSVYYNQAGLAQLTNLQFAANFENRFMVKELSTKSIAAVIPVPRGTFGVSYSSFGYSLFRQNRVTLAYAMPLGNVISPGIQLNYFYYKSSKTQNTAMVLIPETGIQIFPIKNLTIAAHVFNPAGQKITNTDSEQIPVIFTFGFLYKFGTTALLTSQIQQNSINGTSYSLGIEYLLLSQIALRTGFAGNPTGTFFGIGYRNKGFGFDLAANYHPLLGYTTSGAFTYIFNKKTDAN